MHEENLPKFPKEMGLFYFIFCLPDPHKVKQVLEVYSGVLGIPPIKPNTVSMLVVWHGRNYNLHGNKARFL